MGLEEKTKALEVDVEATNVFFMDMLKAQNKALHRDKLILHVVYLLIIGALIGLFIWQGHTQAKAIESLFENWEFEETVTTETVYADTGVGGGIAVANTEGEVNVNGESESNND